MTASNIELPRNSFFDDDELHIKFDFQKIEKQTTRDYFNKAHPELSDNLFHKVNGLTICQQSYYGIINRHIIFYKSNSPKQAELVLECSNARLIRLMPAQTPNHKHGFSLQKNGNIHEFYSNDEKTINNWFHRLRKFCVMINFHDEYKALKMIGKGSFAKVYLVENKYTVKEYAVKAFTKENVLISSKKNAKPSMINEIDIMRAVDHENLIKLYEVYETEKSIYLVLELVKGRSLQDMLKKSNFVEEFTEAKTLNMIKSILEALAYLASKNIMHRDLKPDNILLEKNEKIKIVDFGLATFINVDEYIFKKCGTPGYIAPEVFKYDAKNPSTFYDAKCDVFSAGSILYYMLFGKPFFNGENASDILRMNRKFTTEFDSLKNVKDELKNPQTKINKEALNLLSYLLEFDHTKRISASQALQLPYFTSNSNGMHKSSNLEMSNSNIIAKGKEINDCNNSGNGSPLNLKIIDFKLSDKVNQGSSQVKEKYAEKDSLYLDLGPPLINGKVDTLTQGMGSANNSLLLSQALAANGSNTNVNNSNPNSLSHFAKGANIENKGKGGFKSSNSGGNSFLKAAIFRNMQKNNEYLEEYKEIMSPTKISETNKGDNNSTRRYSERIGGPLNITVEQGNDFRKTSNSSDSGSECSDISNENAQVDFNVERMKLVMPNKHPSKMVSYKKQFIQKIVESVIFAR